MTHGEFIWCLCGCAGEDEEPRRQPGSGGGSGASGKTRLWIHASRVYNYNPKKPDTIEVKVNDKTRLTKSHSCQLKQRSRARDVRRRRSACILPHCSRSVKTAVCCSNPALLSPRCHLCSKVASQ